MIKKVLIALGNYPTIEDEAREVLERTAKPDVAVGYLDEDDLIKRIEGANAVILGAPRLTRKVILAARKLEVICRRGIGVDNIDVKAASEQGVVVTNVPDILTPTVMEHAIMLMLAVSRKLVRADQSVRAGKWEKFDWVLNPELAGKTLGIVGLGSLGSALGNAARSSFGMRVLTNDNPHLKPDNVKEAGAKVVPFEELLRDSDYLVLTVPLTDETRGMIGERELRMMKRSSFLINVARGLLVDEVALYGALKDGTIAGAGLDVLERQPPEPDNPLLKLENVVLTPHCAGLTIETSRKLSLVCVEAITKLFKGEMPSPPVKVLNPDVARQYIAKSRRA